MSWLTQPTTMFDGAYKTAAVEQLTLGQVLTRNQDDTYKAPIKALRALRAQDAAKYKEQKTFLPAFTPGCALHTRAKKVAWKDKLIAPSQIIHLDVDHIDAAALKARVIMEPSVVFAFLSPSGEGLKLGIASAGITDDKSYKQIWRTTIDAWKTLFPDAVFKEDEHVKFLHALCFVSHDPDLYVNDAAVPFLPPPSSSSAAPPPSSSSFPEKGGRKEGRSPRGGRREGGEEQARVEDAMQAIPAEEYDIWLRVGMGLHASGEPWARAVWDTWSQRSEKYDAAVQEEKWSSFTPDGGVNLATMFHLAQEHGYRPPPPATVHVAGRTTVPGEADGESPQHAADALLACLPTLAEEDRLAAVLAQVEMLAALDMPAWMLLKPQLKRLAPGVTLRDLDRARNEKKQAAKERKQALPQHGHAAAPVQFLLNKEGRPRAVSANVEEVFEQDPRWQGMLAFDELANEVMLLQRPPYLDASAPWLPRALRDPDASEASIWLQRQYDLCVPTPLVAEVIEMYAGRSAFHVIRDYLHSLTWDHTARLDRWLVTYCHAKDTAYTRAVGRNTLIAAVARVMAPGCKVDTVCILEGEQGTLKSTVWRTLASDPWFSDTLPPNLADKDACQALRGKWLIEMGDLAAMRHNEKEVLKRFISAQADHYRPSYGRRAMSFPRMSVFVGSTNQHEIFDDETGNRRYWPVAVTGLCDIAALKRDRDQLWAEALHLYLAGAPWHLTPELERAAAEEQEARLEVDPWEDRIMTFLHRRGYIEITTEELFRDALGFDRPDLWSKASRNRLARILRQHGWMAGRVYITLQDTYGREKSYQVRGFVKQQP